MKQQESQKIEVEFRSRFDEVKYKELERFFKEKAKNLGEDNKNVFFFILPDKLLKVVDNVSQKTAKIVLKLNKIGQGSDFEEIEIPISSSEVTKAVKIFSSLNLDADLMESFQKRHNYLYKGVEAALKYSEHWGYHLELEVLIDNFSQKETAEARIRQIAQELDVHLMTDQELKEFTQRAEDDYKKRMKKKKTV